MSRIILLCVIILLIQITRASGADLNFELDKANVKWGEVFTLEVEAKNPTGRTVQGGITVSFSSNLIVTDMDSESKIYYEGSNVFKKGHICCVKTRDIMVENWYENWPSNAKRKMTLKLFVLKTGSLKIYARAAFIKNIKKKQIIEIPQYSSTIDQQKYPVHVKHVVVKESTDFLRNFQLIINNSGTMDSPDVIHNIQRLINNPRDRAALRFFGIDDIENSPNYLKQLKKLIKNPKIVNSPDFMYYLKRVVNNPSDENALRFFGVDITSDETKKPTVSEKAKLEATNFICAQKGGENLIALLEAEGDIYFITSEDNSIIKLNYYGDYYEFHKNKNIVSEIAKIIIKIKPDSEFIQKPDPITRTSYRQLIQ